MEKLVTDFLPARRKLFKAQANLQKSPTAGVKRFMVTPEPDHHQLRLIVVRRPAGGKDGDGPGGETLARNSRPYT